MSGKQPPSLGGLEPKLSVKSSRLNTREESNLSEFDPSSAPIPDPLPVAVSMTTVPLSKGTEAKSSIQALRQKISSKQDLVSALAVGSIQDIRKAESINDSILELEGRTTSSPNNKFASTGSLFHSVAASKSSINVMGSTDGLGTMAVPTMGTFSTRTSMFYQYFYDLLLKENRFNDVVGSSGSNLQLAVARNVFETTILPILEWIFVIFTDLQMSMWAFHRKIYLHDKVYFSSLYNPQVTGNATVTDGATVVWTRALFNIVDYRSIVSSGLDFNSHVSLFAASAIAVILNAIFFTAGLIQSRRGRLNESFKTCIRFSGLLLGTVLFLPILTNLTAGTDCITLTSPTMNRTYLFDSFPEKTPLECGSTSNIAMAVIGILLAIIHVLMSVINGFYLVSGGLSNPARENPTARVHGRADVWYLIVRVFIVILFRAPGDSVSPLVLASMAALGSAISAYYIIWYFPHYTESVNHLRFGILLSATFVNTIVACDIAVRVSKTKLNLNETAWRRPNFDYGPTDNLVSILVGFWLPIMGLGYMISKKVMRSLVSRIDGLLYAYDSIANNPSRAKIVVFKRWQDVEISVRCILQRSRSGRNCFKIDFARDWPMFQRKFQQGTKEFGENREIVLACLGYLNVLCSIDPKQIEMETDRETQSRVAMNIAYLDSIRALPRHLEPSTDRKLSTMSRRWSDFQVYFFTRTLTESNETRDLRGSKLIWSQYKDLEWKAEKSHHECLRWFRKAWKLVLETSYKEEHLRECTSKAIKCKEVAIKCYEELITKCPQSQLIRRKYAAFLLQIGHQPQDIKDLIEEIAVSATQQRQ